MFRLFTCGRKKQIPVKIRILNYFNELTSGQTVPWAFHPDKPNHLINCLVKKDNASGVLIRLHAAGYAAKRVQRGSDTAYDVLTIEFSDMQKHELFVTIAEKEIANKSNWCRFTRR